MAGHPNLPQYTNPHSVDDGSDDDFYSTPSPTIEEIPDEEFPTHFDERNGRLFPASASTPYPLPVDTPEQERQNVIHNAVKQWLGGNYIGPVPTVLAEDGSGREKMAIDLCTGTGRWVTEMASAFPRVSFIGMDIVPIQTRFPDDNVDFEIFDINDPWDWTSGSTDLVNARFISMAVHDYRDIIPKVARVLRRNGLFISYEWGRHPAFWQDMEAQAPHISQFFSILNDALRQYKGLGRVGGRVQHWLQESGLFSAVYAQEVYLPVGNWPVDENQKRIGKALRKCFRRFMDSIRPFLHEEAGMGNEEIDELFEDAKAELANVPGLACVLHTVYAFKA